MHKFQHNTLDFGSLYNKLFIFNADAKFGKESVVETVLKQNCSEIDLRAGLPSDLPQFIPVTRYQRTDENTLIAYCDHKNCNTKEFIETSMKESLQDDWTLIKSRKGICFTC